MIAFILAGVLMSSVTEASSKGLGNPLLEVQAANLDKYRLDIGASPVTYLKQHEQVIAETGELFHQEVDPRFHGPDYFPNGIKINFNEVAAQNLADVKDDGTAESQKPVV